MWVPDNYKMLASFTRTNQTRPLQIKDYAGLINRYCNYCYRLHPTEPLDHLSLKKNTNLGWKKKIKNQIWTAGYKTSRVEELFKWKHENAFLFILFVLCAALRSHKLYSETFCAKQRSTLAPPILRPRFSRLCYFINVAFKFWILP